MAQLRLRFPLAAIDRQASSQRRIAPGVATGNNPTGRPPTTAPGTKLAGDRLGGAIRRIPAAWSPTSRAVAASR